MEVITKLITNMIKYSVFLQEIIYEALFTVYLLINLFLKLGSIVFLLYFVFMKHSITLCALEGNQYSNLTVKFLQAIPATIIIIILLSLITIVIYSIFYVGTFSRITSILIVAFVLYIGVCLALSEYTLDNKTPFLFFSIIHPIPIESKLTFLQAEVLACYNEASPPIVNLVPLEILNKFIEAKLDIDHLQTLNAQGISLYARELFLSSLSEYYSTVTPVLTLLILLALIMVS